MVLAPKEEVKAVEIKQEIVSKPSPPKVQPQIQVVSNPGDIKSKVRLKVQQTWGDHEWNAMHTLINNESGWRYNATNKSSGAGGLFQALPYSKTGCGSYENVDCQINWGIGYIKARYGSPSRALAFWMNQSPHWY